MCSMCSATLMYSGGTSTMRNHIKHKHPSVIILEIESQSRPETVKRQSKMIEFHRSRQMISRAKQESLNTDLAIMSVIAVCTTY